MPLATYKDLCIDAVDAPAMASFWAKALWLDPDPDVRDDGVVRLTGPTPQHTVWVNPVAEPKTVKQRVHLDINAATVEEFVALGAVVEDDSQRWTVLTDPEGGEFCVFVRDGEITQRLHEIIVDSVDHLRISAWWADVLGARLVNDERGFSWIEDIPGAPLGSIDFIPVPEPRTVKNRLHLDVTTMDLDALVGAGARVLRPEDDEISWTVLADPEGNEFCAFLVEA